MRNSSLEQRVAMIQNIREVTANNEKTMSNIHNIMNNTMPVNNDTIKSKNKFLFRLMVAIILFGIYAYLDWGKVEIMGYNSDEVEKMIEYNVNYKEVLNQFNNPLTNGMNIE